MWGRRPRSGRQLRPDVQTLEEKAVPAASGLSAHAAQIYVDTLYQDLLHRVPDLQGEAYWIGVLQTNGRPGQVLAAFEKAAGTDNVPAGQITASLARAGRHGLRARAHQSALAFVDSLYQANGLPIDSAGEAAWLRQVRGGASRAAVSQRFMTSLGNVLSNQVQGALAAGGSASGSSGAAGTGAFGTTGSATGIGIGSVTGTGIGTIPGSGTAAGGIGGPSVVGGNTPTSSATFIGPISPLPTGGFGLTSIGGLGTTSTNLTAGTALGNTGILAPGLGTTNLGATGTGASTATGTLGNILMTNGLSGPTIGNVTGSGGTGL